MINNWHWFFKVCILFLAIFIFWFFVASVIPKILPTKVISGEIRGLIFQNQIWRGDIFINGDLVTLPNVRITITPGTKVYISKSGDKNNFDLLPWHLNHGVNTGPEMRGVLTGEPFWDEKEKVFVYISNLTAEGSKEQPIIFTSSGGEGSPYDINLIRIENGELSRVNLSNYRRLEAGPNVLFLNSTFENTGECAICIQKGNPLIKENTFKKGKRDFINIFDATPLILANKFLESEGDGISVQTNQNNQVRIFNNLFTMPSRKVIKIKTINQKGDIAGNNFILGEIELPCSNKVRLTNNLIRVKILFKNIGGCSGEYLIYENYWEIMDIQSILNARISGTTSQFQVKISKILKNPPKDR